MFDMFISLFVSSAQSQSDEELVLSNTKTFICDQIIRHLTTEESTQPEMLSDSSEAHRHVSRNSGDSSENVIPAGMSSSLHRQQTLSCRSAACKAHGVACRSRRMRKARKAKSKRWSNVKYTKAAVHLGPADMTMQPDLEDVDGMLFVSFGVKVHRKFGIINYFVNQEYMLPDNHHIYMCLFSQITATVSDVKNLDT